MTKLVDRMTLIALCVLSIAIVSASVVKNWHKVDLVSVVHAQSNPTTMTKTLIVDKTQRLDAIEVTQVLEGSSQITPGDPSDQDVGWLEPNGVNPDARQIRSAYKFQAGQSWLQGLTLVLRNRTSKNIVRLDIGVTFPETASGGAIVGPRVRFGRLPANVAFYGSGQAMPASSEDTLLLAPGQAMAFNFVKDEARLERAVGRVQPFSTISICYIHLGVSFDDGMIWTDGGAYSLPDPELPGTYLPPDRTYFPGPLTGSPGE